MRSRRWWTLLAISLGLGGVAASAFAAQGRVTDERAAARQQFDAAASDVAAGLQTQVVQLTSLADSAQAFVRRTPDVTTSQLQAWVDETHAFDRQPALIDMSVTDVVRPEDLPAHVGRVTADAAARGSAFTFQLQPAEPAAAYCLQVATVGKPLAPIDQNLCPGADAQAAAAMRSHDATQVIPGRLGGQTYLAIGVPLYRTVSVPATPAEREQNFVAFVGISIDATAVLRQTVKGHAGVVAGLEFDDSTLPAGSAHADFRTGTRPTPAMTRTIDLGSGWRVIVAKHRPAIGLLTAGNASQLLGGGAAVSILLALLLYVLATGRFRALRMVAEKTEELQHRALHDPLTGLANRALLMDRAEQLLARSRRSGHIPACLYLDLDGFKNINDSLGHEAGDRLLHGVAARLLGSVREADTIARMGGDEFVVLIDGATMDAAPELVAERLVDVVRQPFDVDGVDTLMRVTASVGIALGDRPGGEDLVRDADFALYEAKGAGRNRVVVFREDMPGAAKQGAELEFDLRSALEREEFRLAYQPIYDIDGLTLVGFEALLRWAHPTLGLVQPGDFIPTLERTGQIVPVGRWVLHEACRQLALWRRRGSHVSVAVNVASQQFDSGTVVDDVRSALAASGLTPTALSIEITETSLMRNVQVCAEQLAALRALGVKVAIDDFGTGYSSLASLQRLPVDTLKIDRSFVAAMSTAPEARALVRTIVQLGKELGLKTLAEGVETPDQLDELRDDRVNEAQGFLLARPLDPQTVERTVLAAHLAARS